MSTKIVPKSFKTVSPDFSSIILAGGSTDFMAKKKSIRGDFSSIILAGRSRTTNFLDKKRSITHN